MEADLIFVLVLEEEEPRRDGVDRPTLDVHLPTPSVNDWLDANGWRTLPVRELDAVEGEAVAP